MLKKNERKNIKEIQLEYKNLYAISEDNLITPSLAIMINNYLESSSMDEHNDFETRKINYIKKRNEYSIKKQYNNLIVDLYLKGHIIINNENCDLRGLYILFQEGVNNYYLTYSKSTYTDFINKSSDSIPYNKAIKFIDSTAFIALINSPEVNIDDNTITIDNNETLINILNNWDGYLHNKIWYTESINNKKILKEE